MTPCKRAGHTSGRRDNGDCIECSRERQRAYYLANKEKALAAQKDWRERNPEVSKASMLNWQKNNPERVKERRKEYRAENPEAHRANQNRRRAALLQRIPLWANLDAIKSFYKACPLGMQVDHIIPLQGETVCGLHVEYNLQYLTPEENMSKGNRYA